jgi:hypothetical protein
MVSAALQLLGEYSHSNNFSKRIMGLYLYATGSQRQPITVMSHLGLSVSYYSLVASGKKTKNVDDSAEPNQIAMPSDEDVLLSAEELTNSTPIDPSTTSVSLTFDGAMDSSAAPATILPQGKKPRAPRKPGTLRSLSNSMRDLARGVAATGLYAASYDNINMVFKAAEQIIGRTG